MTRLNTAYIMKLAFVFFLSLAPAFGRLTTEDIHLYTAYPMSGQPSYTAPIFPENTNALPAIHINGSYLNEKGRGDLFQIARYKEDLTLEFPLFHGISVTASENNWQEHTLIDNQTHMAEGVTLTISTDPSKNIRGSASWTEKRYNEADLKNTGSGYGRLSMNLYTHVIASIGVERSDEIYNYFGMAQGAQADNWLLNLYSDITPKLEINGTARYINYSDDNEGVYCRAFAGYAITDHPRLLKVSISQEYRDTKENYLSLYFQNHDQPVNIIHPYWCPWNYSAQTLTFEWNHDISPKKATGGKHVYELDASFSMDSDNNPSAQFQAKWHREIGQHWTANLSAMIYRSKEWDAESALAQISYKF